MRIAVLNGVNLDVLDRRDAGHYGGLTLADLESRIYAWSKEFECTTRCRQTNHEGQFIDWCHDALDWADGVILNPGAWSHYSYAIRDAVELFKAPVVEVHLSKIEAREEWRRVSVIGDLATKRVSGEGPEGYRTAIEFLASQAMSRIERLAALLDEPLLVTSGVNVRYLTGLSSSNAAVLVDPDGDATLFTDFRYAQKASALEGVRFEQTARAVIGDLATRLAGQTIGIEAHVLTVASHEQLRDGGVETISRTGHRRAAARDQGAGGDRDACARRPRSPTASSPRSPRSSSPAGPRSSSPGACASSSTSTARRSSSFDTIVAAAENGASPHADVRDVPIPANTLVTVDAGCRVDGYASDCTRTFATGDLPDELARAYEVCLEAQLAGLDAYGPGVSGRDADAAARDVIAAAGWGEQFGHGLGHGIGLEVHEAPAVRAESTDTLEAGNVVSCEPGIYLPGVGGVRIEDMVLVTDGGSERLTQLGKELTTVR